MAKRTTHRSSAGKKLYAVRDASGKFKDIQTYERAHRQDLKRKSGAERKAAKDAGHEMEDGGPREAAEQAEPDQARPAAMD